MSQKLLNETAKMADMMTRKPVKSFVFDHVRKLVLDGKLPPDEAAALYAYFMPAPPKKPKTAFQWVALAVAGKNEHRYYLRFVYVTDDHLVGCDGFRLHVALNADGLPPGYYNVKGDRVHDTDEFAYPDWARLLAPYQSGSATTVTVSANTLDVVETGRVTAYAIPTASGEIRVPCNQFKDAIATDGPSVELTWTCQPSNASIYRKWADGREALIQAILQ